MFRAILFVLFLLLILLPACGKLENAKTANGEFPPITEPYGREKAAQNGDVVIWGSADSSYNIDKWIQFLKQYNEKKPAQVRITKDTMEGGFVIEELYYDGERIHYSFDNTRDNWGADPDIYKSICEGFQTVKLERGAVIALSGCGGNIQGDFGMWEDVKKYNNHKVP